MLTIEYDPENGKVVPDGKLSEYLEKALSEETKYMSIGSFLFIDMVRALIKNRKLESTAVEFKFKGNIVPISKYGYFDYWPKGFGDTYDDILFSLL